MVTKSGSVSLGKGRETMVKNELSFKATNISANGIPNKVDYIPMTKIYHGKHLSVDPRHIDIDENVMKVMKTTTYSIGKKGFDAPNEVNTTN